MRSIPHHSLMLLHVFFKSSLVAVIHQQSAFVERKITLAEGEVALVLFAHVSDHEGVQRWRVFEGLNCARYGGTRLLGHLAVLM